MAEPSLIIVGIIGLGFGVYGVVTKVNCFYLMRDSRHNLKPKTESKSRIADHFNWYIIVFGILMIIAGILN